LGLGDRPNIPWRAAAISDYWPERIMTLAAARPVTAAARYQAIRATKMSHSGCCITCIHWTPLPTVGPVEVVLTAGIEPA
jgi:hypothetical protein